MKTILTATAAMLALSAPLHADGDAEKGEKEFKKCKACHMIESPDETIVKGGKTGPNLYGIVGRAAASEEGFKYGESLAALGEAGLVWNEENLEEYMIDPKEFLAKELDDSGARSKMTFKLRKGGDDVAAYLATFSSETSDEGNAAEASSD